jgi:hypothetical protein
MMEFARAVSLKWRKTKGGLSHPLGAHAGKGSAVCRTGGSAYSHLNWSDLFDSLVVILIGKGKRGGRAEF